MEYNIVSEKIGIWPLGCLLYIMIFKEQSLMNVQKLEIINGNNNFPDYKLKCFSKKYVDSIRSTLMPNPNNRPNILYLE